jgi:DNA modification methylase
MTALVGQDDSILAKDLSNRLFVGDAKSVIAAFKANSIDLVVTSPPYWTAVAYEGQAQCWSSYEAYLHDIGEVLGQCARVLRANGKLCVNAPIMPIPKDLVEQHTRHLKNIAFDLEHVVLSTTELQRYGLFIWQKQTSKMMFGSYPYPGNILENNTIEFINVYVKPGKPPKYAKCVKDANVLGQAEWVDLTQQVWFIYPEDVKRERQHPAPFPEKLPARLIRMYSFGAAGEFEGEIVLDPFCGTGATCAVAKRMNRRFVGIDIAATYVELAQQRVDLARPNSAPVLLVGRPKYANKAELERTQARCSARISTTAAAAKHKRETYGRGVGRTQLLFDFSDGDDANAP